MLSSLRVPCVSPTVCADVSRMQRRPREQPRVWLTAATIESCRATVAPILASKDTALAIGSLRTCTGTLSQNGQLAAMVSGGSGRFRPRTVVKPVSDCGFSSSGRRFSELDYHLGVIAGGDVGGLPACARLGAPRIQPVPVQPVTAQPVTDKHAGCAPHCEAS